MNQQQRFWAQYAYIANRVGQPHTFTRPADPLQPLAPAPYLTQMAAFNQDVGYSKPNKYGVATWLGVFDGTSCDVGDIVKGPTGTYFIAAMQYTLPIYMVQCNRTVSISRPVMDAAVGAIGYGGAVSSNETTLMAGWPASVLQGSKGEINDAAIPNNVRVPWWQVLMPAWPSCRAPLTPATMPTWSAWPLVPLVWAPR